MPQNGLTTFQNQQGNSGYGQLDGQGVSALVAAGLSTALNVTTTGVVKVGAGRLVRVIVINGGTTSGGFALNDSATVAAAATANQIFSLAEGASAGQIINLDVPFTNGLVVSGVPGGGTPQLTLVFS